MQNILQEEQYFPKNFQICIFHTGTLVPHFEEGVPRAGADSHSVLSDPQTGDPVVVTSQHSCTHTKVIEYILRSSKYIQRSSEYILRSSEYIQSSQSTVHSKATAYIQRSPRTFKGHYVHSRSPRTFKGHRIHSKVIDKSSESDTIYNLKCTYYEN